MKEGLSVLSIYILKDEIAPGQVWNLLFSADFLFLNILWSQTFKQILSFLAFYPHFMMFFVFLSVIACDTPVPYFEIQVEINCQISKDKVTKKKKKKKKHLFCGCNQPKFSILADFFFFFLIFPKSCKISHFWPKSKNFSLKFVKISQNIFPKLIFLQKKSDFFRKVFVFLGSFLLPEIIHMCNNRKQKTKRPTDPTWQVCPSALKTGWFFFFFFFFCGKKIIVVIFCYFRWVCVDIPELQLAMRNNVLNEYDTNW